MIPKLIHYCWYGKAPLSDLAKKCIDSWKQYCPDYTIIRWDETNTVLNKNEYIREAYKNGKWAFITDYMRLEILYSYGGIYMDTDVELLRNLDSFLYNKAFSGFEDGHRIPTGIMASEKGHPFIKKALNYYSHRHFVNPDGTLDMRTNVDIITEIAMENGFVPNGEQQIVCEMTFYPHDVFCPKNYYSGTVDITNRTVCIHHFDGSWMRREEREYILKRRTWNERYKCFGELIYYLYRYLLHPNQMVEKVKHYLDR